ncbi:MAG: sigma-54 dependent transcriptional regulator [Pseudomonadota bacterium]
MNAERVLVVDDEEHLRIVAQQTFELADIDVECCATADEALKRLKVGFDGVLVTDIRMPGMDGVALLEEAIAIDPELPVILVTGHGDVDLAVQCIKNGAYDFIEKPWQPERLVASVRRAAERRSLALENRALREQVHSGAAFEKTLFGRSELMRAQRQALSAIAATDVDVLITGDTGTGKEVAARLVHRKSSRSKGPFVHINCAALPDALIESELFGHEAGAFPGATRARYGKLEHARGGILCLDEVDLLPLALQAKLLDVLHNRTVTRLGSNDSLPLDIRVISLAKSNLAEAVNRGTFRADLLYRLNVASLHLPDLKDRREDIPGLFTVLAAKAAQQAGVGCPDIPTNVLNELSARDWPGNVRELRNQAERFVLGLPSGIGNRAEQAETLAEQINAYEKSLISAAISANGGRLKETYESLGLSRKSLYDKMQKHGLKRDDFGEDA